MQSDTILQLDVQPYLPQRCVAAEVLSSQTTYKLCSYNDVMRLTAVILLHARAQDSMHAYANGVKLIASVGGKHRALRTIARALGLANHRTNI